MSEIGTMKTAVNDHVVDHLVNGPVSHRELMDKAEKSDAIIAAVEAFKHNWIDGPGPPHQYGKHGIHLDADRCYGCRMREALRLSLLGKEGE